MDNNLSISMLLWICRAVVPSSNSAKTENREANAMFMVRTPLGGIVPIRRSFRRAFNPTGAEIHPVLTAGGAFRPLKNSSCINPHTYQ
jgi:hypothetical protein